MDPHQQQKLLFLCGKLVNQRAARIAARELAVVLTVGKICKINQLIFKIKFLHGKNYFFFKSLSWPVFICYLGTTSKNPSFFESSDTFCNYFHVRYYYCVSASAE